jgi:hypothetical protein
MIRNEARAEAWRYIFNIFPFVELPFGILSVVLSDHWLFNLCLLPFFPVMAYIILYVSEKKNLQPGYFIGSINGSLFMLYIYMAGPKAPAWPMLVTVSVGASFMFNNPRAGQLMAVILAVATSGLYFYLGAGTMYSLTIFLTLFAFIIIFARTYDYLQIQQKRLEEKQKEILDSIHYAKRIQNSVMTSEKYVAKNLERLKEKKDYKVNL